MNGRSPEFRDNDTDFSAIQSEIPVIKWVSTFSATNEYDRQSRSAESGQDFSAECPSNIGESVVLSLPSLGGVIGQCFGKSQESMFFTCSVMEIGVSMSVCQYVSMSVCQYFKMSVCQYFKMSVCQYFKMSVFQNVSMSVCQYVSISKCQYVSMSVCYITLFTYALPLEQDILIYSVVIRSNKAATNVINYKNSWQCTLLGCYMRGFR